jgi:hypothetical protein
MVIETGGLDLRDVRSGGSIARVFLERLGITPPLEKFPVLDDADLDSWAQAAHGGWCWVTIARWPLPVVDVDINDAYSTIAVLLGWWDHVSARELVAVDCTDELTNFLSRPDELEGQLFNPNTWRHWGFTLVELRPVGEPLPIVRSTPGVDPRLEVTRTTSPARSLYFTWPDVALATLLSGHAPRIEQATRLEPVGTQFGLRSARFRDFEIDPSDNPVSALVRRRRQARRDGDRRLARVVRVISNSLVYGEWARTDPSWRSNGHHVQRIEVPGPWCWPPIAATIPAGCRLILALLDRALAPYGGLIAYRDTDGAAIPALPNGARVELRDGTTIDAISWTDLDRVLARFDPLRLSDSAGQFWKVRRGDVQRPWFGVFAAPKRWVFFTRPADQRIRIEDASEHGLAGSLVTPPGNSDWSGWVAEALAAAVCSPAAELPSAPWNERAFPALRRRSVTRPDDLRAIPDRLGVRPFGSYLQALHAVAGAPPPVAPEWGQPSSWRTLPWFDHHGRHVRVSTDFEDLTAVPIETLETKAAAWGGHELLTPNGVISPESVTVHPALIRRVGRGGGKYRGDRGELIYDDVDVSAVIREGIERLGVREVSSRTGLPLSTVKNLRAGTTLRSATVEAALRHLAGVFDDASDPLAAFVEHAQTAPGRVCQNCAEPLMGRQRRWCSERCRLSWTRRIRSV